MKNTEHSGAGFWRSLDELAGTKHFEESLHREFAPGAAEWRNFNRRAFLKLIGASLALAGLPACTRQPIGRILPYVNQPEELISGKPMFFATAMTLGGFATGLIVESHEGHPTKIEGNPGHPASLGATNIFHQAALLDLYDPDRSQDILQQGRPDTWDNFVTAMFDVLESQKSREGAGLRILTETIASPALHGQIQALLKQFPKATWHQYEPANRDNARDGSMLAFGQIVESHYQFDKAKVVVSFDSDFLYLHPHSVRYARDFASLRRARFPETEMNRLYVIESSPTVTGSNADHRFPLRAAEIEGVAFALAKQLGARFSNSAGNVNADWISAVAADLSDNPGQGIIVAGRNQPATVHALAHLMNHQLRNSGETVTYADSAEPNPINQTGSLRQLVEALDGNAVDVMVILGGNPAFTAPADFQFGEGLKKAKFSVHLAPDVNETSSLCVWHIPQNHFLESWGDARAFDGTISIIQPLILPLYYGKSAHELLDAMLAPLGRSDYEIVRGFWESQNPGPDFEDRWRKALHDGFIAKTNLPEKKVKLRPLESLSIDPGSAVSGGTASNSPPAVGRVTSLGVSSDPDADGLEITFRPDPTLFDGRFANNGWLQELPKPVTKLTWDNSAFIPPALADREELENGDVVEIEFQGRRLSLPVWITPGQPGGSIGLQFGYGRSRVGTVGTGTGFNVYKLRTSGAFWSGGGATLKKTGARHELASTEIQHVIDSPERQIVREGTFEDFRNDPDFVQKNSVSPSESGTLFKLGDFAWNGYRWGMVIDLSACIGCSACTIACQAENNIPVVGQQQVAAGRIMHWIRVDGYFRGAPANPQITHQPVPCMQCENAPCEVVCPVGATVHDKEGLNLQVYNRCIGTRYCSNNCPYKVRRFNFLQYADYNTPSLKPMWNPNVTLRWRGVMEKCTYCLQRISAARITAENQDRTIREGEIQTACQQVCPANAITFGNLNDPNSRVGKLRSHPLNFLMLGELNTRPRTAYLAKLRNPNPKIRA
ncbi:MAG TPA: TAT-variant-translocated molybdopterin oxidoreductase [Verrucomicrobiae bacterium]|nr:TAT-variant-translocated molybdopterin oxidoreductase [Verrucomicrobiae bacterium]